MEKIDIGSNAGLLYRMAKKVPDQLLFCLILMVFLKVLNGTKVILDDQENPLDLFRISLVSFRS